MLPFQAQLQNTFQFPHAKNNIASMKEYANVLQHFCDTPKPVQHFCWGLC